MHCTLEVLYTKFLLARVTSASKHIYIFCVGENIVDNIYNTYNTYNTYNKFPNHHTFPGTYSRAAIEARHIFIDLHVEKARN